MVPTETHRCVHADCQVTLSPHAPCLVCGLVMSCQDMASIIKMLQAGPTLSSTWLPTVINGAHNPITLEQIVGFTPSEWAARSGYRTSN